MQFWRRVGEDEKRGFRVLCTSTFVIRLFFALAYNFKKMPYFQLQFLQLVAQL